MVAAYGATKAPDLAQTAGVAEQASREIAKEVIKVMIVMDDARMRLTCIIGAIGGALISIGMFHTPRWKPMLAKFMIAAIGGSMFTPAVMRGTSMPLDTDWILCAAGVVAICAYSVLQSLAPLVPRALAALFRQKYLPPEDEKTP